MQVFPPYLAVLPPEQQGVWPLERGLGGAVALFGSSFQPAESLKALVYFSGGDLAMLNPADRATLQTSVAAIDPRAGIPVVPRLSQTLIT